MTYNAFVVPLMEAIDVWIECVEAQRGNWKLPWSLKRFYVG